MPAPIFWSSPTSSFAIRSLDRRLHAIIADAVRDGRISRLRIEKAYGKIILLKRRIAAHDLSGKW